MTVLGRSASNGHVLPANVEYIEIDYEDQDSLVSAFRGHDAAILTHSLFGVHYNKPLIDASIKAGIRRIIPSHYGSVATNDDPEVQSMPVHGVLTDIRRYLEAKARAGLIEYTVLEPGCFLETLAVTDTALDIPNRRADLWDDGNHRFSVSTLAGTGKAMVGVLRHGEASKNRVIRFHEFTVSQNELLAIAQDAFPPAQDWKVAPIDSAASYKQALEDQVKDPSFATGFALLKICMMSGRWGVEYPEDQINNDLIGLGRLQSVDVERAFKAAIEKYVPKE